ncbi:MAG: glycine cleavage system protein H [Anaerolineaceae bacterium]|nr:glycine cleavage system protein H [Anaerolineaceae bacterium]
MTIIGNFEFPDDLYYTKEHLWVKTENGTVTIGLTQFGQAVAGDILFVETPHLGREITKDDAFMSMESGKWVGRVKAPLSGKISETNSDLEWETDLVNKDPYGQGWLTKIEASDLKELDNLFKANSPEFSALIMEEKQKYNK